MSLILIECLIILTLYPTKLNFEKDVPRGEEISKLRSLAIISEFDSH